MKEIKQLRITRTIKKINLSHFLLNSSCFLNSSLLRTKPTAQLLLIKPMHGDSILIQSQPCTATLNEARELVPGLAKSAPCSTHSGLRNRVTRFRDTASRPSFDSATFTIFYCRAVSKNARGGFNGLALFLDSFLMTFELSATTTVNGDAQVAP